MRKQIFGRKLKRDYNERKALFRSLMSSLVIHGKITTSEAKAKSIKSDIDKLITYAKTDKENAKRLILKRIPSEVIADKIIAEIAPKFENRPGGYTRILKMGEQKKDGSRQVLMSWTEQVTATSFIEPKRNEGKKTSKGTKNADVKAEKTDKKETKAKKEKK